MLKGTTDIIIFPKKYEDNINLRGGIQIMIELKNKKPSEADRRQAVLQLITASFCSNYPVVVILTNLNEFWQFIWFSKSGIDETSLGPSYALTMIQSILNEEETCPLYGRYTLKQYLAERQGMKVVPPGMKVTTQVSESPITEDEFLLRLRTKVDPYDFIPRPDVGNMEDFFGEMSDPEVAQYKLTKTMEYLTSTPTWQAMYA